MRHFVERALADRFTILLCRKLALGMVHLYSYDLTNLFRSFSLLLTITSTTAEILRRVLRQMFLNSFDRDVPNVSKIFSPSVFSFVQWIFGWKNIPNFEGNLEFWAKKLRDVPIQSPQDYSKLLEVSSTIFNDSQNSQSSTKKATRNWSILYRSKRNSTFIDDDRKSKMSKARLAAKNGEKATELKNDMGRDLNPEPCTPTPPSPSSAVVQIEEHRSSD